jgi:hypothetical protein
MASFTATPAVWTNNSDANFRAWGSYVAARFGAVGLIQTADTGQINWTTVTTPAGINTYQGYEVWRFADALQTSAPVFFKIQYGEGASADGPGIRLQFGSGSDGAGNLTGNLSALYDAETVSNAVATTVVGSGSTGRFVIAAGFTASSIGLCFGFERSKDSTGGDTTEAVLWISHADTSGSGSTSGHAAVWSTTLGVLGTIEIVFNTMFAAGTSMAFGSQTMVAPVFHNKGVFMNPGLNCAGYYTLNITPNGTANVYMYGASHIYYALPSTTWATGAAFRGVGSGTAAMLIRYE